MILMRLFGAEGNLIIQLSSKNGNVWFGRVGIDKALRSVLLVQV